MIRTLILTALLAGCLRITPAAADDAPYAEYRVMSEFGQIQITTGFVERTEELMSRRSALESQGIVVLEADTLRTFTRTARVGTHQVVTTITIMPPAGHGEGGASSNVDIRMVVDGVARVDCPLAQAALGLDRVVLEPERGFVTLTAHDGILRFDGFESRSIVDADWLANRETFVRQLLTGRK